MEKIRLEQRIQINPNLLNISSLENTFTTFCFANLTSLDHIGILYNKNRTTSGESIISLIQERFQKNENNTFVSTTNRSMPIYPYASGCSFLNLLCRDSFTASPSLKASSLDNSDLSKALLASLSNSCIFSSWNTASPIFLDQLTLGNISILCLISSGISITSSDTVITSNTILNRNLNNFSLQEISEIYPGNPDIEMKGG
jgi:hypothetical protein